MKIIKIGIIVIVVLIISSLIKEVNFRDKSSDLFVPDFEKNSGVASVLAPISSASKLEDGNNIIFITATTRPVSSKIFLAKYNPEEKGIYEKHLIKTDYSPEAGQSMSNINYIDYNEAGDLIWRRSSSYNYYLNKCIRFLENGECVPEGIYKNNIYDISPHDIFVEPNIFMYFSDSLSGVFNTWDSGYIPVVNSSYPGEEYFPKTDSNFSISNTRVHVMDDGSGFLYTSRKIDKILKKKTVRINFMDFKNREKTTLLERDGIWNNDGKDIYTHLISKSPDGKYIIFESDQGIEILNSITGSVSIIENLFDKDGPEFDIHSIHWE